MRRVEISLRSGFGCIGYFHFWKNGLPVIEDGNGRIIVCGTDEFRFLDPPEEREIGSHGIKYLARKVGELEDKLSKLSAGLDKVYKELSEEIEKLSACVSSELTEEVNNEKK